MLYSPMMFHLNITQKYPENCKDNEQPGFFLWIINKKSCQWQLKLYSVFSNR
jgi:hypothetical protein